MNIMKNLRSMWITAVALLPAAYLHAGYRDDHTTPKSPWCGGVKSGISMSSLYGSGKPSEFKSSLGNPMATGNLYVEYAFNDYVGAEIGVGYMQLGGVLKCDKSFMGVKATGFAKAVAHSLTIPFGCNIYLLGREAGEGILKLFAGGSLNFRLNRKASSGANVPVTSSLISSLISSLPQKFQNIVQQGNDGINIDIDDVKNVDSIAGEFFAKDKIIRNWDLALMLGIAYECSSGFFVEARGAMGLVNILHPEKKEVKERLKKVGFTAQRNFYISTAIGYNLCALWRD